MPGSWPEAEASADRGCGIEFGIGHLDGPGGGEVQDSKLEAQGGTNTQVSIHSAKAYVY